jgi:galactitol-specific phosphotransferase system IIC component
MDTDSTLNNKLRKARIKIVVYVLMHMMLRAKTKTCTMVKYKIWELDFHGFKIPLFCCSWVDAIKGVVQDKYGFINVDLNR